MAYQAECDICHKDIKDIKDVVELDEHLAISGRVESICKRCSGRINRQMNKLAVYYHRELAKDLREFVMDLSTA